MSKLLKFVSWNVNGIRAVSKNIDFVNTILKQNYDFICLQEVKADFHQVDMDFGDYNVYWNSSKEKKGYSGTAIFTKEKPINVIYGIGIDKYDLEGRTITLEYDEFFLVNCYVPNSGEELKRLDFRLEFEEDFKKYLNSLKGKKGVILCGDLNVAHNEIDLKNPKTNTKNAGFTIEERTAFNALLDTGFIDTFRYLYPDIVKYSWWSYRFFSREKNTGWRIDYFIVSNNIIDRVVDSTIENDIFGSDHCPVILTLVINS